MNWAMLASPPPPFCWPGVCSFSQNTISKVQRTIQSLTCLAGGETSLWAPHIRPSLCWEFGDGKGNWPPHLADSAARTLSTKSQQAFICSFIWHPQMAFVAASTQLCSRRSSAAWPALGTSKESRVQGHLTVTLRTRALLVTRVSSMQMPTVQQPLLVSLVLHQIFDQATGSDTTTLSCLFQTP